MKRIYADHSATTKMSQEVFDEILPYLTEKYGNASSLYTEGNESAAAIGRAREQVAKAINCEPREVFFTAGGTESDNWAIRGTAFANQKKGNHIITSKIEHHAVLHTVEYLEKRHGFEVTYLDVDEDGIVDLKQLEDSITDQTILITIMAANNEIGTIQPIEQIGEIAKAHNIPFHTDAVQAIGQVPIDVKKMNISMLSMSGHKIYGPKGIGMLYIKKGTKIDNYMLGGAQEHGRRAGTENVPGIVGLGKAITIAVQNMEENNQHLIAMRDRLINEIEEKIPYVKVNGHRTQRLPNNVNVCFRFIEGEGLLLHLDLRGISASSGSACTSGSLDPSHVLLAIGLPHEIAHGSLRLSLGLDNTMEDVDYIVKNLIEIVALLRNMSPLYEKFVKEGK